MKPVSPAFVAAWFEVGSELPVAGIATDALGIVTHWSPFATTLYGWAAENAIGRDIRDLTVGPTNQDTAQQILEQLGALEPWEGEFAAATEAGAIIDVHVIDLPVVEDGALVGIVGLSFDVSAPRRDLVAVTEHVRSLASEAEAAAEDERRQLARMIHDDLGQRITALCTDLHWLEERHPDPITATRIEAMLANTDSLIESVRRICAELRPPLLDDLGAAAAIDWMLDQFVDRTGIRVGREVSSALASLPPRLADEVYQIVRECITNVERHADATSVHAVVRLNDALEVVVADDGRGMDTGANRNLGLHYMTERVERLDGTVSVTSMPGAGTEVRVRIPWT